MYQHWIPETTTPELRKLVSMGIDIFDDSWTTYIPEHKKELCEKIIENYYFNEICCPSIDRFIFYINTHLRRIMPYYNQLYASELIKIDPMLNHAITTNGRSIENLLKLIKTDSTKSGKILRDFINSATGSTLSDTKTNLVGKETLDGSKDTVYNKEGTDDSTTDGTVNETYHENVNETYHETVNVKAEEQKDRTIHETSTADTKGNVQEDNEHSETSDTKETTDKTGEKNVESSHTDTEHGTISDDGNTSEAGQGTKDWTETKDDKSNTHVVTDLDESSSENARKDYADTPQIQLSSSAGSPNLGPTGQNWSVRTDYLTNVTWDTSSSTHKLDSTVDTDFTDNEEKVHTEKTSDTKTTLDKNVKTTDMGTDGVAHEGTTTADHSETTINTDKQYQETKDKDYTENVKKNTDTTDDTHTTSNSDTNKNGTKDTVTDGKKDAISHETYDDDWTEKGDNNVKEHQVTDTVKDTVSKASAQSQSQGRENESQESGNISKGVEDTSRTIDTGTTNITTGFMNITASALLEAFRKTFLNVDLQIIEELSENFMEVF